MDETGNSEFGFYDVDGDMDAEASAFGDAEIVEKDGRYALLVDGAPYLILGTQVNNSSAWADHAEGVARGGEDWHQYAGSADLLGAV